MIHAQADLKATLKLSERYESVWHLLNEAVAERSMDKVRLANAFIDSDEFDAVPDGDQRAMLVLLSRAMLATGWGA